MIEMIPYDPMLTKITGSVSATLLLCRLEMLFARRAGASFVKFLEPAPGHPHYRPGESFAEELTLIAEAFRTAFKKIGVRHRSRAFEVAATAGREFVGDDGRQRFYASFTDRGCRRLDLTSYVRNGKKINSTLRRLRQLALNV
jgi:hypothetical protein